MNKIRKKTQKKERAIIVRKDFQIEYLEMRIQNLRRVFKSLLIALVLLACYILAISFYMDHTMAKQVPKNLGATYYDTDGNIWIRLESNDAKQLILAKNIEYICKVNDIPNCMSAADRLGVSQ